MTQDDYKLFTGADSSYTEQEWTRIVNLSKTRLMSFLCLSEFPAQPTDDLKLLWANFIAEMVKHESGSETVESKHVRNFTINFKTTASANAFASIAGQYQDIIDMYSNCGNGVNVEHSKGYCCGR